MACETLTAFSQISHNFLRSTSQAWTNHSFALMLLHTSTLKIFPGVSGAAALLLFLVVWLPLAAAQSAEESLRKLAAEYTVLPYGWFLTDSEPRDAGVLMQFEKDGTFKAIPIEDSARKTPGPELAKHSFEALAPLAEHNDIKIRTLALMGLFATEDRRAMPIIAARLGDEAPTFPGLIYGASLLPGEKHPIEPRTVGSVAKELLNFVGFPKWPPEPSETLEQWRRACLDNPDWIGWYQFLHKRATGGSSAPEPERAPKIAALRKQLDALRPTLRGWVLLYLTDDHKPTFVATNAEVIAAAKVLGSSALLDFLRNGSHAGVQDDRTQDTYGHVRRYILKHGKELFSKAEAGTLFNMGHYVTAADANPALAGKWLRIAAEKWSAPYQRWDVARAMAALIDHRGDAEAEFAVKWLYEVPDDTAGSSSLSVFLAELTERRVKDWEGTLRRIVAHPKFEYVNTYDVGSVAIVINQLGGKEVFTQDWFVANRGELAREKIRAHFKISSSQPPRLLSPAFLAPGSRWNTPVAGRGTNVAIHPGGKLVAVSEEEGRVSLFSADTGAPAGEMMAGGRITAIQFDLEGNRLFTLKNNRGLIEWDLATFKATRESPIQASDTEAVLHLASGLVASRGQRGIAAGRLPAGRILWTEKMRIRQFGLIALSSDGRRLATCDGFSKTILLWDAATGKKIASMDGHSGTPTRAAFSPDGAWLISAAAEGEDEKVILWDGRTGALKQTYLSESARFNALGFTPDSKYFFASPKRGQLALYETASGKPRQGFAIPHSWLADIGVSPDGKSLFTLSVLSSGSGRYSSRLDCWEMPAE
jgi:hypothetical protein